MMGDVIQKDKLEACAKALYAYDRDNADRRWATWNVASVMTQNKYLARASIVLEEAVKWAN